MDGLALLCTLHADGPSTLRGLRRLDCSILADLTKVSFESLREVLATTPAGTRRFLREAEGLEKRLGLEPEEGPVGAIFARVAAARSGLARDLEESVGSQGNGTVRPFQASAAQDATSSSQREPLLAHDEVQPFSPPEPVAAPEPEPDLEAEEFAGFVASLPSSLRSAVESSGLGSLDSLLDLDALELSRRLELRYTAAWRLQALARRTGEERVHIVVPAEAALATHSQPQTRSELGGEHRGHTGFTGPLDPPEPNDWDAGGPFA